MRRALGAFALMLAVPALAQSAPTVIFSQSAAAAWTSPSRDGVANVALRTGHAPAVALEERPGRRVGTIREQALVALWRGTFRTDPPNAVLTGLDARGRKRRAVVVIRAATRTRTGVRYRVRILRGAVPRYLRTPELVVDGVPFASVGRSIAFPATRATFTGEHLVVTPSQPFIVSAAVSQFSSITLLPGASLRLSGSGGAQLVGAIPGNVDGCDALGALGGEGMTLDEFSGRCILTWRGPSAAITASVSRPTTIVDVTVRLQG